MALKEFEVLKTLVMKTTIFWDFVQCNCLEVSRRFGGKYYIHTSWSIKLNKMQA
jgi:hypothetical protein